MAPSGKIEVGGITGIHEAAGGSSRGGRSVAPTGGKAWARAFVEKAGGLAFWKGTRA